MKLETQEKRKKTGKKKEKKKVEQIKN